MLRREKEPSLHWAGLAGCSSLAVGGNKVCSSLRPQAIPFRIFWQLLNICFSVFRKAGRGENFGKKEAPGKFPGCFRKGKLLFDLRIH